MKGDDDDPYGMETFSGKEAAMPGPDATTIELDDRQRQQLEQWVRDQTTPKRVYLRARVVLFAADGWSNSDIARKLDYHRGAVVQWRNRFAEQGVEGLHDLPRPGRPPAFSPSAEASSGGPGVHAAGRT
jgi:hypothetical protein